MKFVLTSFLVALISSPTFAIVDQKNANFSDTFTDLIVPGSGYDLRVQRTYNSRSLFNGIFGFGWCSDFETKLEVTPEGNLLITECGGGLEVTFTPKDFDPKAVEQTISKILSEVKKRNSTMNEQALTNLRKELGENRFLREEFGRQLELKGDVSQGTRYYANGRETENIILQEGLYVRALEDGSFERFNRDGQLVQLNDRSGNYLKIEWNNGRIRRVLDNNGRQLVFTINAQTNKVEKVVGPNELTSTYKIESDNLLEVKNAWGNVFKYQYDNLHNITRIQYPDGTFQALTYNQERDWVTSFRDRQGCLESYNYEMNPENPKNHFWSTVEKKCGDEVVNRSRYEFWHRERGDQIGNYLHRVRIDNNNRITDVTYHPVFGRPVTLMRDSHRIAYSYYDNGLIQTKQEAHRHMTFYYRNQCRKVSDVLARYLVPNESDLTPAQRQMIEQQRETASKGKSKAESFQGREVLKTVRTNFQYDQPRCNLVGARNTDGQVITLRYDGRGRINRIQDQARRIVEIQYENRFGKPSMIRRPGLGTMTIAYGTDGQISNVDSEEGPTVALQVAGIFNNLLEIIAPATGETSI